MNNHELAKKYEIKSKALGKNRLELKYLDKDRVVLEGIIDDECERLIIPSFITDIKIDKESYDSPLTGKRFTEILIDNSAEVDLDISYMMRKMESDYITVKATHPERIVGGAGCFMDCINAKRIDLTGLAGAKWNNFENMFCRCERLKHIVFGDIDTSKVTSMSLMFYKCKRLGKIENIDRFDTWQVTDMYAMFKECESLENIDLARFDTYRVEDMSYMFSYCKKLKELNLGNFKSSNLRKCEGMVYGCKELRSIKFGARFMIDDRIESKYMLWKCPKLSDISLTRVMYGP